MECMAGLQNIHLIHNNQNQNQIRWNIINWCMEVYLTMEKEHKHVVHNYSKMHQSRSIAGFKSWTC